MTRPQSPVSRGTPTPTVAAPEQVRVVLPVGKRPGVLRVGGFTPGVTYTVPVTEAIRLVTAKGFELASDADAEVVRAFATQFNAAAPSDTATPSQADGQGGGTHIPQE